MFQTEQVPRSRDAAQWDELRRKVWSKAENFSSNSNISLLPDIVTSENEREGVFS